MLWSRHDYLECEVPLHCAGKSEASDSPTRVLSSHKAGDTARPARPFTLCGRKASPGEDLSSRKLLPSQTHRAAPRTLGHLHAKTLKPSNPQFERPDRSGAGWHCINARCLLARLLWLCEPFRSRLPCQTIVRRSATSTTLCFLRCT